jgi:hypothetical protein
MALKKRPGQGNEFIAADGLVLLLNRYFLSTGQCHH